MESDLGKPPPLRPRQSEQTQLLGLPCVVVSSLFLALNGDSPCKVCEGDVWGRCDLVASKAAYISWGRSGIEYMRALHKEKESSQVSVIQGDPSLPAVL